MWMKNEDELVEAVLEGDHSSFEVLLKPYRQGLLNMAYRMTGDIEEAKEICQEALIRVFRHLKTFRKGKSFKSWVYRITVNATYDFLRAGKRQKEIVGSQLTSLDHASRGPEGYLLDKEIKRKIEHILQVLSPKEKLIFILRDGRGFNIGETAKILGCSSSSVRTHLSRARRKIRDRFREDNDKRGIIR